MSVCMNAVILFLLKLVSVDFHLRNSEETFATNIGLKIKKLLELEAVSSFLYKKKRALTPLCVSLFHTFNHAGGVLAALLRSPGLDENSGLGS